MKVSIIIPVYNVADYVKECLISVYNQTYKDIEVIIIDDCGTDNSMDIVNNFVKEHKDFNFKIIRHNTNKGLSAARNTGIRNSSGYYIFFLDSDDTINYYSIETLIKKASIFNFPDLVLGNFNIISSSKTKPELSIMSDEYIDNNEKILSEYLSYKWDVTACNKLLKKEFITGIDLYFWEGIYHEDNDFSFRLALSAGSMAICHELTYNYYIRSNSITTNKTFKNYSDYLNILTNNIKTLNKSLYIKKLNDLCSEYIINLEYSFCFYLIKDNSKNISLKEKSNLLISLKRNIKELNNYVKINNLSFKLKSIIISLPVPIIYLILKVFILLKQRNINE